MKIITAIAACAMMATAVPAFAQSYTGSDVTTRPNGGPGSTSGTDAKNFGYMNEGRASADDYYNNRGYGDDYGYRRYRGPNNGPWSGGYDGATGDYMNGNMAPGGGPGLHD